MEEFLSVGMRCSDWRFTHKCSESLFLLQVRGNIGRKSAYIFIDRRSVTDRWEGALPTVKPLAEAASGANGNDGFRIVELDSIRINKLLGIVEFAAESDGKIAPTSTPFLHS